MEDESSEERAQLTAEPGAPPPERGRASAAAVGACLASLAFVAYVAYLSFEDGATLFSVHPLFMSIGWLLVVSSGLNAFSSPGAWLQWAPIDNRTRRHWALQTAGLSLILVAYAAIFANKIRLGKPHFATWHGTLGLVTFALSACAACGGLVALYAATRLKGYVTPAYAKPAHAAVGLLAYASAAVTMSLPFASGFWKGADAAKAALVLALALIALWAAARPAVKLYARVRERINYIRTPN